jgi:hypothetical protein
VGGTGSRPFSNAGIGIYGVQPLSPTTRKFVNYVKDHITRESLNYVKESINIILSGMGEIIDIST